MYCPNYKIEFKLALHYYVQVFTRSVIISLRYLLFIGVN